ncbi:hypothetical protein B0T13DRAFT_205252 [Neurospora crassa]|nr:hypothetical protein B0T13DRAFT_205252 [Neurospora crassa]
MTRLVGEEEQAHASFPSIVIRGSRVRIGSDTGRDGPSEELEILRRARRYVTSAPRESASSSPIRNPSTCVLQNVALDGLGIVVYAVLSHQLPGLRTCLVRVRYPELERLLRAVHG